MLTSNKIAMLRIRIQIFWSGSDFSIDRIPQKSTAIVINKVLLRENIYILSDNTIVSFVIMINDRMKVIIMFFGR